MATTRRLAAILAADVAGYSRLMGADEEGTHERLKAHFADLLNPKIAEHRGRVVKNTGDGLLAEFASVVDAVRCAVEIQRGMIDREPDQPEERRIRLRIGINLGDVIVEEHDIFGDGVNVAARLEGLAEPDGICVSRVVRDQVRDKLPYSFEDRGEQQVKNIARPVRVYRVRDQAVPVEEPAAAPPPPLPLPNNPSIAVLPFANMSSDPEQEFLADGIAEDIITALSRFPSPFVIARDSSFTHKGRAVDIKVVGRELGARYVLDGSLRRSGNRIRVTAQLVETETGKHVWAEHYDHDLADIFAAQDKIAEAVTIAVAPAVSKVEAVFPPTNLPEPVSELIGRDDELREILGRAALHRLVTLTGTGGIGKTRLALAVARRLLPQFADGVCVAELAPLADPGLVPAAVAAAAGLELGGSGVSPERVANALSGKRLLLVLDNCEHVIAAAAMMTEALLHANPAAHVIVTSREPLKAEGERVYPVPPLAVPAEDAESEDDLLRYGAVRLFVERVGASEPHFAPDRHLAMIVAICRRLDGIPLAIELASARAATLSIEQLAAHLDDRFRLLTGGRRTALPRHQTLRATLDWSYELLTAPERMVLRRLAIFAGSFSLEAAGAVAASAETGPPDVLEDVAGLVAKSLVAAEVEGAIARYRLLDTTRAYALEKLSESGELEAVARHHAEYCRDLFERAETEWEKQPTAEWLADYRRQIDNLRAALDWAFSPSGDASIGVALTAASVPLWVDLSMMAECRGHVERALARLRSVAELDPPQEMHLQAAFGMSLNYTAGPVPETEAAWTRTLEIAKGIGNTEYQLRALRGLWEHRMNAGEYRTSLALAYEFSALAATTSDPGDLVVADGMAGIILHYLGDQIASRQHLERRIARSVNPVRPALTLRFLIDQRVAARALLARIAWLQGFPDQAASTAQLTVDEAAKTGHALSLCHALAQAACPIALFNGDLAAAARFTAILLDRARELGLAVWIARAHRFQGVVLIMKGDFVAGLPLLREALDELREAGVAPGHPSLMTVLARSLGQAGRVSEGLAVIDQALALSEQREERWSLPEVFRNKGELLVLEGSVGAALAAEDCFRQALDWARRDGTLSYELRAAFSLGRLWRDQGRGAKARDLVASVYRRFTEGFETADLQTAKRLLNDLTEVARP